MQTRPETRKKLNKIAIIVFIFAMIFLGFILHKANEADKTNKKQKTQKIELQEINFQGSINPSVSRVGDTVLIKVEVENLGDKPINDIKLLFSNKNFIEEGLTITNVMDNGIQDGRGFKWNNDIMKIPPKEKRTFQISAKANKPGKYETIIQIKPMNATGMEIYSDPSGNEELKAKMVVTQ
ncbi:TPA: hypothetical protein LA742_000714 [Clostridium botulinum]|nr:hypothetical protein [Clostridium botulinum]